MSLFQCETCGAKENTALGAYWGHEIKCCSECDTGQWHGRFKKIILPLDRFETDSNGNLAHKESGDTDIMKYAIAT